MTQCCPQAEAGKQACLSVLSENGDFPRREEHSTRPIHGIARQSLAIVGALFRADHNCHDKFRDVRQFCGFCKTDLIPEKPSLERRRVEATLCVYLRAERERVRAKARERERERACERGLGRETGSIISRRQCKREWENTCIE